MLRKVEGFVDHLGDAYVNQLIPRETLLALPIKMVQREQVLLDGPDKRYSVNYSKKYLNFAVMAYYNDPIKDMVEKEPVDLEVFQEKSQTMSRKLSYLLLLIMMAVFLILMLISNYAFTFFFNFFNCRYH